MEDIKTAIAECEDMIMLSEQNFHRRVNDEDDDSIFGLDRVLNIAKAVKYIEQKVTKKVNDTEKYLNQLDKSLRILKEIVIKDLISKETKTLDELIKKLDESKFENNAEQDESQNEIEVIQNKIKKNKVKLCMFELFYKD